MFLYIIPSTSVPFSSSHSYTDQSCCENVDCSRMSQPQRGSDPSSPEQVKDNNYMSVELIAGSTGQSSLMPVRSILIKVDAEPSTSNQNSFREDKSGARHHDTELPDSAVLYYVGAHLDDQAIDSIPFPSRPRKRTRDTSRDLIQSKKRVLEEGVRGAPNLKITKSDIRGIGNITSRSADTDDETIEHADNGVADIVHSAVAIGKRA